MPSDVSTTWNTFCVCFLSQSKWENLFYSFAIVQFVRYFETTAYDAEMINRYLSTLDIEFLMPLDDLTFHQRISMDPNWDWKFEDVACLNSNHFENPCPHGGSDVQYHMRYPFYHFVKKVLIMLSLSKNVVNIRKLFLECDRIMYQL